MTRRERKRIRAAVVAVATVTLSTAVSTGCSDESAVDLAWGSRSIALVDHLGRPAGRLKRKVFVIDRDGARRSAVPFPDGKEKSFGLGADGVTLRLPLSPLVIHQPTAATPVEESVALGTSTPKRSIASGLGMKPYGVVMLEIIDGLDTSKASTVEYARREYTLFESDFLKAQGDLEIEGEARGTSESGVLFVPVDLADTKGAAVAGAQIFAANIDYSTRKGDDDREIPLWHMDNYRPVAWLSDARGKAMAGPIFTKAKTPRVQIYALSKGRCTIATEPETLNPSEAGLRKTLVAETCAAKPRVTGLFEAAPTDALPRRDSTVGGTTVSTFLTNGSSLRVALKTALSRLRPVRVAVEEWNGSRFVDSSTRNGDLGYFSSTVRIELPEKLATGGTDGVFRIRLGHARDRSPATESIWQTLYVDRSRARPKFRIGTTGDTSVGDASGRPRVAQTGDGSSLRITSTRCEPGASFAALLGLFNLRAPIFYPCEGNVATLPYADLVDAEGLEGEQPLRIFFRDAYGNESQEDAATTQTIITVEPTPPAPTPGPG